MAHITVNGRPQRHPFDTTGLEPPGERSGTITRNAPDFRTDPLATTGKADAEGNFYDPLAATAPETTLEGPTRYTWGVNGAGILDPNAQTAPGTMPTGPGGTAMDEMTQDNIGYAYVTHGAEAAGALYDQYIAQGYTPQQLGVDPRVYHEGILNPPTEEAATPAADVLGSPGQSGSGSSDSNIGKDLQDFMTTLTASSDADRQANATAMKEMSDSITAITAENSRTMSIMMGLLGTRREEDEGRGSFTYNALGGR